MTNDRLKYSLIIGLIGVVFFISFLGGVHLFDWDEINFAEISREMLLTQEFTRVYVDFQPFWEKPPLFFWLQYVDQMAMEDSDEKPNTSGDFNTYGVRSPESVS